MQPNIISAETEKPNPEKVGSVAISASNQNPVSSYSTTASSLPVNSIDPVPVVKVLSVRGVEYAMMTIALWVSAFSFAWVLVNLINGNGNFDYLVVPVSALITTLPIFSLLFIRLKRSELANPALRLEPSKRRMSQITQILAFLAVVINLSVFVYQVLQKVSGNETPSLLKTAGNLLVVLVIAGGILAYYWIDEHKNSS